MWPEGNDYVVAYRGTGIKDVVSLLLEWTVSSRERRRIFLPLR
jgi:hypothetical protein